MRWKDSCSGRCGIVPIFLYPFKKELKCRYRGGCAYHRGCIIDEKLLNTPAISSSKGTDESVPEEIGGQ